MMFKRLLTPIIILTLSCGNSPTSSPQAGTNATTIVADHLATAGFASIPASYIQAVGTNYHGYYAHTSHGSQIMSGLAAIEGENASYAPPAIDERGDDLGHNGDTSWVAHFRTYMASNPECNLAMFSWCGGCSDNTEAGINIYLNKMNELEGQFPTVTFIYMTGHLDGGGPDGDLYASNNQIRAYCSANGKILFDFADIESFNPDGVYFPDEGDECGWCSEWCATHTCVESSSCAHSHGFNCYQKGKAWWWMMARVAGWSPSVGVTGDLPGETPRTARLSQNYPNPFNPSTEIRFYLDAAEEISIEVFNVRGERVTTLYEGRANQGEHAVQWNGVDYAGTPVASGVYFYRLDTGDMTSARKMLLLK